jgi:hypothetical protein
MAMQIVRAGAAGGQDFAKFPVIFPVLREFARALFAAAPA